MNNNYKNIKNQINNKQIGPVFFITPNPVYAIGLERIIMSYFVICSQKYDIVQYLRKEKISILFLNNNNVKNAGKILNNKKVIEYIKKNSKNVKANIITFKPSPMIQKICDNNGFNYLGNNWKLSEKLENKIKFVEITKKLEIPNADSKTIKLDKNKCSLNFSKNNKFVIQLSRGYSGNSTFLIKDKNDLEKIVAKYKNRKVKLSKYFKGETYTINACVVGNKILISSPIFQITGFSLYNRNDFGGTCGNDYVYSQKLKKEQRKQIFNYTTIVGEYIKKLGYKGIFGLDFVVSEKKINLIEINPRVIGSMPLFTKLQIQNNQIPFLLLSILEFITSSDIKNNNFKEWDKKDSFYASQLMLRNIRSKPIKIIKSLKSGIYEIKADKLVLKEKTYYAKNLKNSEFLIQCSSIGRVVSPDIEYANIQVGYGIMKNERQFKPCFERIVKNVLKNIKISI